MKHIHRPLRLLLCLSLMSLASCAQSLVRVQPYERGNLARSGMTNESDALRKAMTEHAYFSREAASGGGGVGGGGCGCN